MSLLTKQDGHVLTLTIDRPDKRNALNEEVMLALTEALRRIDLTGEIRAIVLTASGDKAFCAGGDLGGDQNTFGPSHSQPTTVYADLLRTAWAFRARRWYQRPPFLPIPPRSYMRWRMYTAYGDENAVPTPQDVIRFARWRREVMRL